MAKPKQQFWQYRKNAPDVPGLGYAPGLGYYNRDNPSAMAQAQKARQARSSRAGHRQPEDGRDPGHHPADAGRDGDTGPAAGAGRKLIDESIAEQTRSLREDARIADEENRRRQGALAGFAGALGQGGGSAMKEAIRSSLLGAGPNVAGFASGFSGSMGGAQQGALDAATASTMAATGGAGAIDAPSPGRTQPSPTTWAA